jgi:mannose-6-phosphate isomerase-like protein (cupin superfamily)
MESWFPLGMRTRVHSHSGPEAFYVIEGQQCVETPSEQRIIAPGQSYIVEEGAHLQAAPEGRRSLVLILARPNEPWMQLEAWQPSGYCDS